NLKWFSWFLKVEIAERSRSIRTLRRNDSFGEERKQTIRGHPTPHLPQSGQFTEILRLRIRIQIREMKGSVRHSGKYADGLVKIVWRQFPSDQKFPHGDTATWNIRGRDQFCREHRRILRLFSSSIAVI